MIESTTMNSTPESQSTRQTHTVFVCYITERARARAQAHTLLSTYSHHHYLISHRN